MPRPEPVTKATFPENDASFISDSLRSAALSNHVPDGGLEHLYLRGVEFIEVDG